MNIFANFKRKPQGASAQKAPMSNMQMQAPYAMKAMGESSAEIVLYGDIVSERPSDWWGDPIDGQYIILSEFLEDFKKVESVQSLTVRIHSAGGNASDAMVIHNKLKSMAAEVTVIVDGIAMSAGSMIMCAGNNVEVYPGSLVMIHRCRAFLYGGYNATEMRRMADANEAVDRSIAAIYQAKTGMDTATLLSMMENETYMTGQEAIDNGFADSLVEGSALNIAASADRRTLFVQGLPVWACTRQGGIPAALNIPTVNAANQAVDNINKQPAETGSNEGGTTMAKNLNELRAENPDLANTLMAEAQAAVEAAGANTAASAAEAERGRLREIDEISNLYSNEEVQAAKYGANPCTAQELAFRAAKAAAKKGEATLAGMRADAQASGAGDVTAVPGEDENNPPVPEENKTPDQKMREAKATVKSLFRKDKED